ncbi:MAG TPA: hydantoinase B/oxoprolinase family protein [Bordetella sp.]
MKRVFNSIDRDIFQGQLLGVAEEMSKALRRSAYSPIIWDMYDYSCAILTVDGEILSQAETIPAQLGTMATAFHGVSSEIPLDQWDEGDILICNDPYRGCAHTSDLTLFSPVFNAGELIAIASTIAHHIDVGGSVPGTVSLEHVDLLSEGLVIPPVKLVVAGEISRFVLDLFKSNIRYAEPSLGDLYAQISGCRIAERRITELARRYGNEGFAELATAVLDYGDRYTREMIRKLPDATFEATTLIEDGIVSSDPVILKASLTVSGDSLAIDFTGTSDQRSFGLNCPWASTVSMVMYAVKCVTASEIPSNGGCSRSLKITAPEGSVLNPKWPGAVSARHLSQQAVADVVLKAFALATPELGSAASQISYPTFRVEGVDDRVGHKRRKYFIADILGGGAGASAKVDGMDAIDTHGGNCAVLSAEVMETLAPVRVLRSTLVQDSGGMGKFRGGLAMERDYEILSSSAIGAVKLQQLDVNTAPWGFLGGGDGATGFSVLHPDTGLAKNIPFRGERITYHRGDVIRVRSAGGGGYGNPEQRHQSDHEHDLSEGYVSTHSGSQ